MDPDRVRDLEVRLPKAYAVWAVPVWRREFAVVAVFSRVDDAQAFEGANADSDLYVKGSLGHELMSMAAIAELLVDQKLKELAPILGPNAESVTKWVSGLPARTVRMQPVGAGDGSTFIPR